MSTSKFLQKRGQSYYVRVRVPPSLQSAVGNTHIRRALHTKSKGEAERRKWRAVAEIKAYLDRLQRGESPEPKSPQQPDGGPRAWVEMIRRAREGGDHEAAGEFEMQAVDKAREIEAKSGSDRAGRWFQAATTTSKTLDELVEQWLTSAPYKAGTKGTYRLAYRELRTLLELREEESLLVEDITDSLAARYAFEFLPSKGYSVKAMATRTGALSSFWTYLQQRLIVPPGRNPFAGLRLSRLATARNPKLIEKRAFSDSELVALMQGTDRARKWEVYPRVRDLLILGLYTGARLNELCSLLVKDVTIAHDTATLVVREGKTDAAPRAFAVTHWVALEVLKRRADGKRPDGQLFDELLPSGTDGKPSVQASKAFTRYRRECGVPDGTDYHSLRRTFLTLMEHKGVDFVAVARFVGHQVPTMMHAVYSSGASREALVKVADAVRYHAEVEKAVAGLQ
jgi:integrase